MVTYGARKLSFDEQISRLKTKGITFNGISEVDAKKYLAKNCYYFRIKEYARLFPTKYSKYRELDFEHLARLSTLDLYIRRVLLSMAVDVEHFLKVQLLTDATDNSDCDGYEIVSNFLAENRDVQKSIARMCSNDPTSVSAALLRRSCEDWSLWRISEVLNFGQFERLYEYYYSTVPNAGANYSSYILSIRKIRNAAAHNNCIVSKMSILTYEHERACPEPINCKYLLDVSPKNNTVFSPTKKLSGAIKNRVPLLDTNTVNSMLNRPAVHDITALIYVHSQVCSKPAQDAASVLLDELLNDKCCGHTDYINRAGDLVDVYDYFKKVVDKHLPKA